MRRILSPDALTEQVTPGQVSLRGTTAVYTLRRIVAGTERTELWVVSLTGGDSRPLVSGGGRATCPRIAPDGGVVAFLQSHDDGPAQVCLVPLLGGSPRVITDFPRGAHDVAWYPDGSAVAVLAEDSASDAVVQAPGFDSPTAIRLTRADWRSDGDGDGGLRLYPRHLHQVSIDGGSAVRLTSGPWSASRPRVDASGVVYFLADPGPRADVWPAAQVHRIEAPGHSPTRVTNVPGGVARYHLHGRGLRLLAQHDEHGYDDVPPRWFAHGTTAGGEATPLGDGGRRWWWGRLGDETDLHDWTVELDDGAEVSACSRDGSTLPTRIDSGEPLFDGAAVCGSIATAGSAAVAVVAVADNPGDRDHARWAPDLYALEPEGPRRITDHGAWFEQFELPVVRRLEIDGPAGPITTYLLDPPAGIATKATVVVIHGGPTGQWCAVPPLESIVLASAGYRVAMPNIRGSIDRGAAHVAQLGGAWGSRDVADITAVAEHLLSQGLARAGSLGVMGLSYGGFLTQSIIGQSEIFSAAVAENGVTNQISAWAGSDFGPAYNRSARLADPLTDAGAQALWDVSPLKHVRSIQAPLLMLQGADDRTCPASDNEQLFVALRSLGRAVEYVLYPEESHLMQATARLDRRIDRHARVIAWFDTHLTKGSAP